MRQLLLICAMPASAFAQARNLGAFTGSDEDLLRLPTRTIRVKTAISN